MKFFALAVVVAAVAAFPNQPQPEEEASGTTITIVEKKIEGSGIEIIEITEQVGEPQVEEMRHKRDTTDVEGSGVEEGPKCQALSACHSNEDCVTGSCLGAFVGTCNCNACLSFMKCESDAECGGFKGACNLDVKICDCNAAYTKNGFKDIFEPLSTLCNVAKCNKENATDVCFGLPCNAGSCFC